MGRHWAAVVVALVTVGSADVAEAGLASSCRAYGTVGPASERDLGPCLGSGPVREIWFMTTEERIEHLEAQIKDLHAKQAELRKQLTKAQLDQWQGRIEDLEVQMHLGALETSDKLNTLMSRLRSRWADARRQVDDKTSAATSVAETLRTGLENAFTDLRKALLESRNKLS